MKNEVLFVCNNMIERTCNMTRWCHVAHTQYLHGDQGEY